MPDYVAYYRVSTDRQGVSGLGLDAQREAVGRLVHAGQLVAEYTEIESGKKHTNRPQLTAALQDAKRRRAVLVIAKLDRLARNVHFVSGLMESGVEFVAADMPQANKMVVHIMAAFAEHEREAISERTKAALHQVKKELAEKGQRTSRGGRVFTKLGNPRWKESVSKATAARNPIPTAPQIVDFIQRHRAERETLRQIAHRLNTLGLLTPRGKPWYASTVRTTLDRAERIAA